MRNETFSTPQPPVIRVNLPSGDIRFETSAEANETYVELSGPNEEEARIEQRRNEIVIEIEKKKLFGFKGDYTLLVTAPFGTQVDAHTASADIEGHTTGAARGDSLEITSGVAAGDQIVVAGQQRLRDGARVQQVDSNVQRNTKGGR